MKYLTLLITIFSLLTISTFFDATPIAADSAALLNRDARSSARRGAPPRGEIALVNATQQSVTIQLVLTESDFEIGMQAHGGKQFQTVSFPGCRFISEPGAPRLPMKTALIGIPAEATFALHVVKSEFSRRNVQPIASTSPRMGTSSAIWTKNRFFPGEVATLRTAGWIRENRVLPIQLNPVQYNPVSGEVKLYHRLVVEVQFNNSTANAPSSVQGFSRPESPFYEAMLGGLLINPKTAKEWRAPFMGAGPERVAHTGHDSLFSVPSAPASISRAVPRYKVLVTADGMYHITASDLAAAGIDITSIVPTTLALSNKGRQIPIFVRGDGDGSFDVIDHDGDGNIDVDDEIIFYGQRARGEKTYINPFTDKNIYWLSWNAGPGLRMATKTADVDTADAYELRQFLTRLHFEKDFPQHFQRFPNANLPEEHQYDQTIQGLPTRTFSLTSLPALPDDSWFWTKLSAPEIKTFNFTLTGVAGTSQRATIRVAFHGRSTTEHYVELWLNDNNELGAASWYGEEEYLFEAPQISQSFLKNDKNIMRVSTPGGGVLDTMMLNWFEVDYWRTFEAEADILPFSITILPDELWTDEAGNLAPNFEVQLKNFSNPNIEVYGVDGTRYVGLSPTIDEEVLGTYKVTFPYSQIDETSQVYTGQREDAAVQYIALTPDKFRKPALLADTPSDLRNTNNGADYIIITDTNFISDVQPLADLRHQQGLRAKVVDVQNIYDEFNHGMPNPYALRDFLKYTYQNWQPPAPTYVLLVGDTNVKDKTSVVPTIQVQIPAHGSTASDHQFVTFRGEDSFPDMLVGRVPVTNRVDVRIFVERTINYETAAASPWHKRILMLAGSEAIFHFQTDRLIEERQLDIKYHTERIYAPTTGEETFSDLITPVGRKVMNGFNSGASLVNYIGHGGGGRWASSRMMDLEDPEKNLTNISQLPFVISMTCFTGFFDGQKGCLAEEMIRSPNGGAIAVIGATSIGMLDADFDLNREIFEVIFEKNTRNIGTILAEAKTQFLINYPGYVDLAEVFTLFGDPATYLKLPHKQLEVTVDVEPAADGDVPHSETLLTVSGTLANPNFNGDAEITVVPIGTQATETSPPDGLDIAPQAETANITVADGKFTTQMRIPVDSAYAAWNLIAYAWNANEDAIGSTTYNVTKQYVDNVRLETTPVMPNQSVHLYAEGVNESKVDTMTLYWSWDGIDFYTIPMEQHTGTTYRSEQPIPGYPQGDLVDYYLLIKTKDGETFETELVTYVVGTLDVGVSEDAISWNPSAPYLLTAHITNRGSLPAENVPVNFFYIIAPDGDETQTVTLEELIKNATPIGEVQTVSEVPADGNATISVPWKPPPGTYRVIVFVDMPSTENPKGTLTELTKQNNSASRQFVNNQLILTPEDFNQPIQSTDGLLRITIPAESLQTLDMVTFEELELTIKNQPDLVPATQTTVETTPVAYHIDFGQQTVLTGTATFMKIENEDVHIYRRDDGTGNWIRSGEEIDEDETLSTQVKLPGTFALLSHTDARPPLLELTVENQGFVDGDYIPDMPIISARIEDANGIDPRPENILLTKNGERVPQEEYIIAVSPITSNVLLLTYTPSAPLQAGEHRIRLQAQDANGNAADTSRTANVAGGFGIENIANFPNPFRPGRGTNFAYYLTEGADRVSLKIYTLTGKRIVNIDTLDAAVSYNEYHYDGLDADGEPLANGVYIYKFTAHKGDVRKEKVGKIVVLK